MGSMVKYERNGDIGVISVDHPPVNALDSAVRQGLIDCLELGLSDPEAQALVLVGAGRTLSSARPRPPWRQDGSLLAESSKSGCRCAACAIRGAESAPITTLQGCLMNSARRCNREPRGCMPRFRSLTAFRMP